MARTRTVEAQPRRAVENPREVLEGWPASRRSRVSPSAPSREGKFVAFVEANARSEADQGVGHRQRDRHPGPGPHPRRGQSPIRARQRRLVAPPSTARQADHSLTRPCALCRDGWCRRPQRGVVRRRGPLGSTSLASRSRLPAMTARIESGRQAGGHDVGDAERGAHPLHLGHAPVAVADEHVLWDGVAGVPSVAVVVWCLTEELRVGLHAVALGAAPRRPVALRIVGDEERTDQSDAALRRVASCGSNGFDPRVERPGSAQLGQQVEPETSGPFGTRRAHRRHPQRRATGLDGLGVHIDPRDPVSLAGERERFVGPRAPQDLDRLLRQGGAVPDVHAERVELGRHIAHADAELHATPADVVEHRHLLGQPDRVVEREDGDVGGDAQPTRPRGDGPGERLERRQVSVGQEVVLGEPHHVQAELIRQFGLLQVLGIDVGHRRVVAGPPPTVVHHAEAEGWSHRASPPAAGSHRLGAKSQTLPPRPEPCRRTVMPSPRA